MKTSELISESAKFTHDLEVKAEYLLSFHDEVLEVTKKEFEKIYRMLGVHFDIWDGEFNYANQNKEMLSVLSQTADVEIKESDGAKVAFFKEDVLPSLILIKSDGTSVYLARDILTANHRFKTYHPSKLIYVVGSEQSLHLKQLKFIMEGYWKSSQSNPPDIIHVPYGLMSIEGMKMSTRKGRVLLLEDVIQEATDEMKKRMGEKTPISDLDVKARKLAVGAIIFGDLFQTISKNVKFSWDDILNVEGDTGPYIYYAYARLSGILRKMSLDRKNIHPPKSLNLSEKDQHINQLLFLVLEFDEIVKKCVQHNDPSFLSRYLLSFAKASNAFYHAYPIKKESDKDRQDMLLWMLTLVQHTLNSGAKLLNIELLDEL